MMTQKRFRALAECYGSDLSRWPTADREPAEALLAGSSDACLVLREQQAVDAVISRAFEAQDAEFLAANAHEDADAALRRLRAGVAGTIAGLESSKNPSRGWRRFMLRRPTEYPVWTTKEGLLVARYAGLALGCAFAVTGGLWFGWVQSSGGTGDLLNALLVTPVSGGG